MKKIHQTMCYISDELKDNPEFMVYLIKLWDHVQKNALILGLQEYTWELEEVDLDTNEVAYHVRYEIVEKSGRFQNDQQEYDAIGPHSYHGGVYIKNAGYNKPFYRLNSDRTLCFSMLNFQSYYQLIKELFPDYTTRYIDAPQEVE